MGLNFTTNEPLCPIASVTVEKENVPGTFVTFQNMPPPVNNELNSKVYIKGPTVSPYPLYVNTLLPNGGPIDYQTKNALPANQKLWVTAKTKAGKLDRCPFQVKVCGDETFTTLNT